MQGQRIADQSLPFWKWPPGAYGGVLREGGIVWRATTPNGLMGDLSRHNVTEHEDGTITVSPSILVTWGGMREGAEHKIEWHGYLERGVWREC